MPDNATEQPWNDAWTVYQEETATVIMEEVTEETDLDRVIRMSTPKAPVQARVPTVVPPPAKARPPVQEGARPPAVEIHGPVPGRGMHWRHGWLNKCIPLIAAHQVGDQEQVHALLQWIATLPQVQQLVDQHLAMLRSGQPSPWDFLRMGRPVKIALGGSSKP